MNTRLNCKYILINNKLIEVNNSGQLLFNGNNVITSLDTGNFGNSNGLAGLSITGGSNLTGFVNISAGSNVTLTQIGNTGFSISSAGGGGGGLSYAVTGISTSGSSLTGTVNLTGIGNISLYQIGNSIQISGATSATTVSTWSNLTWETGTIWNTTQNTYQDKKILVMTGNTILQINNLYNGWDGLLQVIQSGNAVSGYSLGLPASTKVAYNGSGIIYLTSGSGARDMVGLTYDGLNLFASIANKYN